MFDVRQYKTKRFHMSTKKIDKAKLFLYHIITMKTDIEILKEFYKDNKKIAEILGLKSVRRVEQILKDSQPGGPLAMLMKIKADAIRNL